MRSRATRQLTGPKLLLFALLWALLGQAWAVTEEELLPPDQAFQITAGRAADGDIRVRWKIADGYYLYQDKIRIFSEAPGVRLGTPDMPPAKIKNDEFFGDVSIYRGNVELRVPIEISEGAPLALQLKARSQGCADIGVCFPPHTQTVLIALNEQADQPDPVQPEAISGFTPVGTGAETTVEPLTEQAAADLSGELGLNPEPGSRNPLAALSDLADDIGGANEDEILPPEEAYQFSAEIRDGRLAAHWDIADGTYLYQDKVQLGIEGDGVSLGDFDLPPAKIKHDSIKPDGSVGDVPVYYKSLDLDIPLILADGASGKVTLKAKYQGCADIGICYPPVKTRLELDLDQGRVIPVDKADARQPKPTPVAPMPADTSPAAAPGSELSEEDQITETLRSSGFWAIIGIFFLIGLGLAFTPCVFPMIPILSGIITGHGKDITTRKALTLSVVYVLAMAVTYTAAGVLAALSGENLQILLQTPWVLVLFAALFVALAMSMFGFYELQLPSSLQSKLTEMSNRQHGGSLTGVAIMGFLSALIVGPCVAPPLAGALIYIGQTGDAALGGAALFAMSMGMGAPLILIGTSAGKLLPRAGSWMDAVKAVFGVTMLGLAIYFLERILPDAAILTLWGLLLIGSSIYMGALSQLPIEASGWKKLWKGLGVAMLIYGALMLIGAAAGGHDPRQPLRGLSLGGSAFLGASAGPAAAPAQHFKRLTTPEELDAELAAARAAGQPVMLDFYADWCVYCKTLERDIFPHPSAQRALAGVRLLQADVTEADSAGARGLMGRFNVIAPPVMVFWDGQGNELKSRKLTGDVTLEEFTSHVEATF